jgi:hypothetical protein
MNDPTQTAINAIENASRVPFTPAELPRLLSTGEGEPSHLRALFGDVDLHTLLRLARLFAVDDATLARAYGRARRAAAANADLDAYVALVTTGKPA